MSTFKSPPIGTSIIFFFQEVDRSKYNFSKIAVATVTRPWSGGLVNCTIFPDNNAPYPETSVFHGSSLQDLQNGRCWIYAEECQMYGIDISNPHIEVQEIINALRFKEIVKDKPAEEPQADRESPAGKLMRAESPAPDPGITRPALNEQLDPGD